MPAATDHCARLAGRKMVLFFLLILPGTPPIPAPAAQDPAGQAGGGGSVRIGDRGPGLKRQGAPALALPVPRTFDLAHVDPAHYAIALGKDPVRIFEFLRDQIAHEAYSGALRGPRGTLLAMAGNSVDRAALLGSLLSSAGKTVRYARGTLPEAEARELVMSMWAERPRPAAAGGGTEPAPAADQALETLRGAVERDYRSIRDHLEKIDRPPAPEKCLGAGDLIEEARRHHWVQWQKDGTWVDLDPSFRDSTPGKTLAAREEVLTALPEGLYHHFTLRIRLEESADGQPSTREILKFTARTPDLSGAGLVLSHQPENWRGPSQDLAGALSSAIEDTGRVKPVLIAGRQVLTGEVFQQRPPKTTGIGGVSSLLRGEGTRKPAAIASAEWIEIEHEAPGGRREVVVREVFDRVGKARRAAGRRLGPGELRKKAEDRGAFLVNDAVYDLFVTTGALDAAHFAGLSADPQKEEVRRADILSVLRNTNITFSALSDALLSRLAREGRSSVVFYPDSPRVEIMEFSSSGDGAQLSMDLRRTRTRAATTGEHPEDAFYTRAFRGVVEGTLERVLLQYIAGPDEEKLRSSLGTSVIFDRAKAEGAATTLLAGAGLRPDVKLSEDTRARVEEELAAGFLVLAPERPIVVGGEPRFAWWRIDPRSGEVIAVADNGLHAEIEKYLIVHNQEQNTCYIVAVLTGGFQYVVDAAVYGTPYYILMMNRIVNGVEMWGATRI